MDAAPRFPRENVMGAGNLQNASGLVISGVRQRADKGLFVALLPVDGGERIDCP